MGVRTQTLALGGETVVRVPGGDGGYGIHAGSEVRCDFSAHALIAFGGDEPGRHAGAGGDGLPDFFRSAGDFDFHLDGSASGLFFSYAHDGSFVGELGFVR